MGTYRGKTVYLRVYAELIHAAEYRGLTSYQDLAAIMGLPMAGNHMGREIGQILNEVVTEEVALGRPMLSAVVVNYTGRPGPGFFALARECGRLKAGDDDASFWRSELEAVYEAWRRPLPER